MFKFLPLAFVALPTLALAEVPKVVADIAPVHALAAQVMKGVGTPSLVVRQGASPHDYALNPQEAGALQDADVVIWLGHDLTPWLERRIDGLAPDALSMELLDLPETQVLDRREGTLFEAHGHAADEDGDHDQDHDQDHDHGHDHSGAGRDPHAWLDPQNGAAWLGVIAAELSRIDPDNAATYAANAKAGAEDIVQLTAELQADLAPLHDRPFIVFHDAYQYFEQRFDLSAAGAINLSDATRASADRVAQLRNAVEAGGITCAMSEPQFNDRLINSVFGDLVKKGVLDPLGSSLPAGPHLYAGTLRDMAQSFQDCLSD